ncbi:MAG: hypothetical protein ACI4I3_09455 [Acutalibacteraceae bacterium]
MAIPPRNHRMMQEPSNQVNYDAKGIIKLVLVVGILVILTIALISAFNVQKEPVTADRVCEIIKEQGYNPQDITDKYYEHDPTFKRTLIKCVAFEEDDIRFDFFEFNNSNSAVDIYGQAYTEIILNYNAVNKIEIEHQMGNFSIYTLDSLGKYNVAIYVGNTAVYANCDSENKNEINRILDAIDYLEP